jgi:large subunit ribosomal protein L35
MPKLKTHRGARKRLKVTSSKKVVHSKAFKSHLLAAKSTKRKRQLGKRVVISAADRKAVKKMLPYEF